MTNDWDTLSPRPAAIGGPISKISADRFFGLDSDDEVDSSRSSLDEFVDAEAGFPEESSTEENGPSFPSIISRPLIACRATVSDKRPWLLKNIQNIQKIDDHPQGYPRLAAFMNSDDNFLIARKYGFLRARVLLYRQDELSVLEKNLLRLDNDDEQHREFALRSREMDERLDQHPFNSRKALIERIDSKLKQYDDLVSRIRTYDSLEAPNSRVIRNVRSFQNYINNSQPLSQQESRFMMYKDDLVSLSNGQESGWLDIVLEDTLKWILPAKLMNKFFIGKRQAMKTDDKHLHLYEDRRISHLVRLILVLTMSGLLVGPSAILFFVPGQYPLKMCLILVFTLIFALGMTISTKAKRHELLAATATYAAVLVVFLGNVNPNGASG